ncbi:MAG TPA: hypothetical protein VF715_18920 [Thermoleophilaceae bacterium]
MLLDRSGSMASMHVERVDGRSVTTTRMNALSSAVREFLLDPQRGLRSTRIGSTAEVAIGCFSGSKLEWLKLGPDQGNHFTLLRDIDDAPTLKVAERELTPIAEAIKSGVKTMLSRIQEIEEAPTLSMQFRPMMFFLTDGIPEPENQDIDGAIKVLHRSAFEDERRPDFFFYGLGINDADDALMRRMAPTKGAYHPLKDVSLTEIMRIVTLTANQMAGYAATQRAVDSHMRSRGARRLGE